MYRKDMMNRVEYTEEGRPYIWTGRQRSYGQIARCKVCGRQMFVMNGGSSSRSGDYCSTSCATQARSLTEYKATNHTPYSGKCNWNYVAGFFDGEGSICSMQYGGFRVSIPQKRTEVLYEIQKFLLSRGIQSGIHVREVSMLFFSNRYAVYKFVMKLLPKAVVKATKLEEVRQVLWEKVRKCSEEKVSEEFWRNF